MESAKNHKSKLCLISYDQAWAAFKRHTVALEDKTMRDRINYLIDYTADQPYALQIRYNSKKIMVEECYQKMCEDDKHPRMQSVTHCEADTIFFNYIRTVIFEENELRSLQGFLRDYNSIFSRYGFPTSGVKSHYIKVILAREFYGKIGFQSRPHMTHNHLVYDKCGRSTYVEAVSMWLSDSGMT